MATALVAQADSAIASSSNHSRPQVPDLTVATPDLGDAGKHYIFHKAGITEEQARGDFASCARHLVRSYARPVPSFVAWRRSTGVEPVSYSFPQFGLIGAVMADVLQSAMERDLRRKRMLLCMLPRGYSLYHTSEAVWKQLNGDKIEQSLQLQAIISAGPAPSSPRLLP
jgi:hypothetical protein